MSRKKVESTFTNLVNSSPSNNFADGGRFALCSDERYRPENVGGRESNLFFLIGSQNQQPWERLGSRWSKRTRSLLPHGGVRMVHSDIDHVEHCRR